MVQEKWLARRSTYVYGRRTIEPDVIKRANLSFNYSGLDMPHQQHAFLSRIWTDFTPSPFPRRDKDILSTIIYGLDLKASNPRDYTYALLGISENTALSDDPRIRRSIYSDYNKSTSGVFTNITPWRIMHFRSLRASQCIHAIRGRNWQSLECTAPSKVMPHH